MVILDCDRRYFESIPDKFRTDEVSKLSKFGKYLTHLQREHSEVKDDDLFQWLKNITLLEFLQFILEEPVDIVEFLDKLSTNSTIQGNVYESLWNLVIKLDAIPDISSKQFMHFDGKVESDMFKDAYVSNMYKYLSDNKIISGNKSGVSDITLKAKISNTDTNWACHQQFRDLSAPSFILFSVKYYRREKTIDKYDIQHLVEVMEHYNRSNAHKQHKVQYKIMLCVKNKFELYKKLAGTTKIHFKSNIQNYDAGYVHDKHNVLDLQDLITHINQLRLRHQSSNIMNELKEKTKSKPVLMPRFHQLLFVNKTISLLKSNKNVKTVLWGQVARSGKTYTAGTLISKLNNDTSATSIFERIRATENRGVRIVVITPAPDETKSQFKDDLFDTFNDFKDFIVHDLDSKNKRTLDLKKNYIIVTSKQFLQGHKSENENDANKDAVKDSIRSKAQELIDVTDMIIFDEIHMGGTTDRSKMILSVLDPRSKAIRIFLTATYNKPVSRYDIAENELMTWTLNDIQLCQFITDDSCYARLKEKFGENDVRDTIIEMKRMRGLTKQNLLTDIQNDYRKFPTLKVLTSAFDEDKMHNIVCNNPNLYGFDINSLFRLTTSTKREFENLEGLRNIFAYIGSNLFSRLKREIMSYSTNQRPFTSQLWFVPYFVGNKIIDMAPTIKEFMMSDEVIRRYFQSHNIVIADDKMNKDKIKQEEIKAFREGKDGLIILVGKKFSLGVSFPCVDVVMFLNNDMDVDLTYQRMFRSLTESANKGIGFVIDLNPFRTISALMDYAVDPKVKKSGDKLTAIKNLLINKTISIDEDMLQVAQTNDDEYKNMYGKIDELIRKNYDKKRINDISDRIGKKLHDSISDVMSTGDLYKQFSDKHAKTDDKVVIKSANKGLGNGAQKQQQQAQENKKAKDNGAQQKQDMKALQNVIENMTGAINDSIDIAAILFSRHGGEAINITDVLDEMNELFSMRDCTNVDDDAESIPALMNNILLQKFQVFYKGDKAELCKTMYKVVSAIIKNSPDINSDWQEMTVAFRSIQSGDMAGLHAYIQSKLPPKAIESKLYGEVFTPLPLVNEMLDAVEKYGNKNVWSNPNLKILDPAAGIGNFPLVAYEKLMVGLPRTKGLKTDEERRRHILENMLYMVELNPTNVKLMEKIFSGGSKSSYKLNILNTDSLLSSEKDLQNAKSDLSSKQQKDGKRLLQWKKDMQFDIIMGNPPFQGMQVAEGKRGGGEQIWDDFVKQSLSLLAPKGLLAFVHPPGWRKPESESSKYVGMYKLMTKTNQMHYLEIHNTDDGQKTFQSGTRYDWYVIQNHKAVFKTIVKDETGKLVKINLRNTPWLPNYHFDEVFKLLATGAEKKCGVVFHATAYETRKDWVKNEEWINSHPKEAIGYKKVLIHSTPQAGVRYMWTNDLTKDKQYDAPMFGVPKVIFGETGIANVISDSQGHYGMTQCAIAIKCPLTDATALVAYLRSNKFQEILSSCQWSNYRIDWRLFTFFKDGFWNVRKQNKSAPHSDKPKHLQHFRSR
jgi:hypothetical protein